MICKSSDMSGRLNVFQRLMTQWSELHPYNAAHVYRIASPADPFSLAEAVRQTFSDTGLGIVHLDAASLSYRHETDVAPEIEVVQGGADPDSRLARHLTAELNRPFERPTCKPWRFSVLNAEPGSHYVVVTYDHWVADNAAARLVLRHVLDRYCEWNQPENRHPIDLYPGTYRDVFAHRLRGRQLLSAGMHSVSQLLRNRAVAQMPYSSSRQLSVQYELYRAVSGTIPQLKHFAKSLGATVNDVILAALGRAMTEFLPCRSIRKQQAISLGTIVDVRGDAREDLSDSMGTFLGYFLARMAADKSMSLTDAVRTVAAVTGPIKERRAYLNSVLNMRVAGALWPHLSDTNKTHFMRKTLPMTAGVSNVVVRDGWISECGAGSITEYLRAVSTGPILPLVLTTTTLGEEMNVGVTYRIAGFSRQKIDGVMERFMDQIEHPAGAGHAPQHRRPRRRSLPSRFATARRWAASRGRAASAENAVKVG